MQVTKLNSSHYSVVSHLFNDSATLTLFADTYLSDLTSFHAYATIDSDNNVSNIISFYESSSDASWYCTHVKITDDIGIRAVLETVIEHNENCGRFKFYCLVTDERRELFGSDLNDRYDFFDEFSVAEKHRCVYDTPWTILFHRALRNDAVTLRCIFLKQQHRTKLVSAGQL